MKEVCGRLRVRKLGHTSKTHPSLQWWPIWPGYTHTYTHKAEAATHFLQPSLAFSHKPAFSPEKQTNRNEWFLTPWSIAEVYSIHSPWTNLKQIGSIQLPTPWLLSPSSRCEYGYYRLVILKQRRLTLLVCPWPKQRSWPSTAKDTAITVEHPKHLAFNWAENWGSFWTLCRMLKESLGATPGGPQGLASLSHVFQNTTIDINERKINLRGRKKECWEGKDMAVKGQEISMPKRTQGRGNFSTDIKVINTKWINVLPWLLSLLGAPPYHAVSLSFWELIPLRSAHFDDANSSWSRRSNYNCPVKYHNAPKDQLTARGAH